MPINDDLTITYNIPLNIKKKLTKEFLIDFKDKAITTFKQNDIRLGREPGAYEQDTYISWWMYMESTSGYVDSFLETCNKYKLYEIIEYYNELPWYDSDLFDSELGRMLVESGLIEEGTNIDFTEEI